MDIWLVAHTHWDREWYRPFEHFRARLVDLIDHLLDLVEEDPGYRFMLDGQSIVLEDYVELRPGRRAALERACRAGQIGIGPWLVQPDSLLPSGESHVRNLIEGARVARQFGTPSRVAYLPDSFGHPAQYPQLFSGFGHSAFIFWRGHGNEIDTVPPEFNWVAPDGSRILACHLRAGYFNSATLPAESIEATERLRQTAAALLDATSNTGVLLLAGADHLMPDPRTGALVEALGAEMKKSVRRGLLDDFVASLEKPKESWSGELTGGRSANLLAGVWSSRLYLKQKNRACEALLEGWAEPWAAFGRALGLADERPALRAAWRSLLENQAHDSLGGCSTDTVHRHMEVRFETAADLARETTTRILERIAGLDTTRLTPWTDTLDLAVFNPSPHPRTDTVRFRLDGFTPFAMTSEETDVRLHPLLMANMMASGFTVDGEPARLVPAKGDCVQLVPGQECWEVEFVAKDVPAFGYRRVKLAPSDANHDDVDDGRAISADNVRVVADTDGTFTVQFGDKVYSGLGAIEDRGDRGDTYDADVIGKPVPGDVLSVERRRHVSGVQTLRIRRRLDVPAHLDESRSTRSEQTVPLEIDLEAHVTPGLPRVDISFRGVNKADDHRLRLLFPTGAPITECLAASTFDAMKRPVEPKDDNGWRHPAAPTFPHQGWVSANGLTVGAPGFPEAEVDKAGTIAVTVLRSVGWLSRPDLESRPSQAGPAIATPGAQCPGPFEGRISLCLGVNPRAMRDAELGLVAVAAGEKPLWPEGEPLLDVSPRSLVVSALKPAEEGDGMILRVLNPTDKPATVTVAGAFNRLGEAVRLDETPVPSSKPEVPPHALRSWRLTRG